MTNIPLTGIFKVTCPYKKEGKTWAFGWHTGIDLVNENRKVYGTCDGIVFNSGFDKHYGNFIVVHSKETDTFHWFCHLEKRKVKIGDYVSRGTIIGIMGNTGNSTGVHLHYEIRDYSNKYGQVLDVAKYMGIKNEVGYYNTRDYQIKDKKFKQGSIVQIPCKFTGSIEGKYSLIELNNTQLWAYSSSLSANKDTIRAVVCFEDEYKIMVEIEALLSNQRQFWIEKSDVI